MLFRKKLLFLLFVFIFSSNCAHLIRSEISMSDQNTRLHPWLCANGYYTYLDITGQSSEKKESQCRFKRARPFDGSINAPLAVVTELDENNLELFGVMDQKLDYFLKPEFDYVRLYKNKTNTFIVSATEYNAWWDLSRFKLFPASLFPLGGSFWPIFNVKSPRAQFSFYDDQGRMFYSVKRAIPGSFPEPPSIEFFNHDESMLATFSDYKKEYCFVKQKNIYKYKSNSDRFCSDKNMESSTVLGYCDVVLVPKGTDHYFARLDNGKIYKVHHSFAKDYNIPVIEIPTDVEPISDYKYKYLYNTSYVILAKKYKQGLFNINNLKWSIPLSDIQLKPVSPQYLIRYEQILKDGKYDHSDYRLVDFENNTVFKSDVLQAVDETTFSDYVEVVDYQRNSTGQIIKHVKYFLKLPELKRLVLE